MPSPVREAHALVAYVREGRRTLIGGLGASMDAILPYVVRFTDRLQPRSKAYRPSRSVEAPGRLAGSGQYRVS